MKEHNRTRGALCLIISSFFFAGMGACVRLSGDIPTFEKALFRNIVALAASGWFLLRSRETLKMTRSGVKYVLMRSVFGTLGLVCNFYALDRINLADASMLNKMSPFYAVLFSWLWLKEKIKPKQLWIIVAAFVGCLLIIKPSGTNMALVPALVAAAGGISAGAAYASLRGATTRGVPGVVVIFVFSVFSCVVITPMVIADFAMPTARQFLFLCLCGCCSAAGQFAITAGYTYAPAREVSVYDYSQVLWSALFGLLIFDQRPDALSVLGYIIVIGLAIVNFRYTGDGKKEKISAGSAKGGPAEAEQWRRVR